MASAPSGPSTSGTLAPPELLAFETLPFEAELHARLRAVLDGAHCGLRETALLHRDLGQAFGRAARALADQRELRLDLVGSHGQTVWHHDGREASGSASLQLGDGDHVAEAAGCAVVSDFRQRDLAAGGEGAPLSSLADELLFHAAPRPTAILNLGGMANLTWIDQSSEVLGFDTGPAGSLLDGLARRLLDRPFDQDGERTARGRHHEPLVEEVLAMPFFTAGPPKSTGRDTFGEGFVDGFVERAARHGITRVEDLLASAAQLCAEAVARGLRDAAAIAAPGDSALPRELIVAGGGLANRGLMAAIAERTGLEPVSSMRHGIDPDAREALVFAVLAARFLLEEGSSRRRVSGALEGRVLGKFSPAPPSIGRARGQSRGLEGTIERVARLAGFQASPPG
jgi:anhydro-N-acetylmuramic acid kinase